MLRRWPLSLSGLITLMGPDSVRLIGLSFPPKEFRWAAARLAWELHGEPTRPEAAPYAFPVRSGGHTSELQSLMRISYAVFCLKKKKSPNNRHVHKKDHMAYTHDSKLTTDYVKTLIQPYLGIQ